MKNIFILTLLFTISLFGNACIASNDKNDSEFFVRRNVLKGNDKYSISDARTFQYGDIHVDGPSGGMLYRFTASSETVKWIISRWSLKKIDYTSDDEIPKLIPEKKPRWWNPKKIKMREYYFREKVLNLRGGKKAVETILLLYNKNGIVYFVEDISGFSGI